MFRRAIRQQIVGNDNYDYESKQTCLLNALNCIWNVLQNCMHDDDEAYYAKDKFDFVCDDCPSKATFSLPAPAATDAVHLLKPFIF